MRDILEALAVFGCITALFTAVMFNINAAIYGMEYLKGFM